MNSSNASASKHPFRALPVYGLLVALLALPLASCSSYQRDFRKASLAASKKAPGAPTGPWKGFWKSEVNGHHGPLWCLISKDANDPETYLFRYRAGWGVLQFGDYTHPVIPEKKGEALVLDHAMTLPKNFGTYRIQGTVTPQQFSARYRGRGDHGILSLERPASGN